MATTGDGSHCTIVVPTRNRRARLLRTLATLRVQDHPDLDILVCDDGSHDDTVEQVAALGDRRVRVITRPDGDDGRGGVARNRNRGLAAATGRWVAFCDDDDLWHPAKLSNQIAEMERTGRLWSYCGAVKVDDAFTPDSLHDAPDEDLLPTLGYVNGVPGGCSSVVARRDVVEAVGGFRSQFSMFADWDLWVRLAQRGRAAPWTRLGVLYVQHGTQMSADLASTRAELSRFRAEHAALRAAHPPVRAIDGVDVWISDRLRFSGQRVTAVTHTVRNLRRLDRYGLRMTVRAAAGYRSLSRSPVWPERRSEVNELVATVRAVGLPPLSGP